MTAPRTISLTYGVRTIGTGTTNEPDGQTPYRIRSTFETYEIEFDFIVTASLATEIAALEDDFSKRRKSFTITFGGSTRTFTEGTDTFESRAELVKRGDDADTANTRLYTARITANRPADDAGGLLERTAELGFDECRHASITLSGVYTATPGATARANYDSGIAALITSTISDVGESGSFNRLSEVSSQNDTNTRLEFRIELLEVRFAESSGGFDVSSIVNQQLSVMRQEQGGEFSPFEGLTVQPPVNGTATYEACISFDVTTDLVSLWEGTIQPWIAENIRTILAADTLCFMESSPTYDLPNNRITAVVTFEALLNTAGFGFIEYTQNVDVSLIAGPILVPVWGTSAFAKYVFQGPARQILKMTETFRRTGVVDKPDLFGFDFQGLGITEPVISGLRRGRAFWVLVESQLNTVPLRRGLPTEFCDLLMTVRTQTYERADSFARPPVEFQV